MTPIPEQKTALRDAAFARRKDAHVARATAGPAACARLLSFIGPLAPGTVVSGYRPIRTEIDPTPAMEALFAAGARLCAPVIEARGRPLKFREWTPGCAMERGAFGAEVPASGDWLTPSVVIVPMVAFDRTGHRLGYGGGFYDRTLDTLRDKGKVRAIGLAYAAQQGPDLPAHEGDHRLDAVVTEIGVLEF
jgi:5-formyltetrahydrofolate cyclo-ligase